MHAYARTNTDHETVAFAGIQLGGVADVLDGTLFVRVAGLTADRLRWMKEGQSKVIVDGQVGSEWDRMGYF